MSKSLAPSTLASPVPDTSAARPSTPAPPSALLAVRDALGNHRFGAFVQTQLTVGRPDDPYELEADRVADRVMRASDPSEAAPAISALSPSLGHGIRRQSHEEEDDQELEPLDGAQEQTIQRAYVQREEDDRGPEENDELEQEGMVQRQAEEDADEAEAEEAETAIQARLEPSAGAPRPIAAGTASRVQSLRGRGNPLTPSLRAYFEPRFGRDFGSVRTHTDADADMTSRALRARAYTFGSNIAFRHGAFSPESDEGRRLLAHELTHVVQQDAGVPRVQRKDDAAPYPPLVITATSFEEAAANFAALLAQQNETGKARIVIVNGPNVRVFDETGKGLADNKFFHLQGPVTVPVGVYRHLPKRQKLYPIVQMPDGSYGTGGTVQLEQGVNFGKDIDDQEGFDKALKGGDHVYYISPSSTAVAAQADAPPPVPIENLPEFMQFEGKNKSNLPAWPSATIPLTPQLATVNSTGTFKCIVDKNQGVSTIDRVTNLMQPTSFRWEVLKLDEKLKVASKKRTTGWDAAVEGYARRLRNLEADRQTLAGDPRKQSLPARVIRAAIADQVTSVRTNLAMAGQTVMTLINAVTGGPNQLTTEDVQDIPFKEQGDYFIRCLATQIVPSDAKFRRATSVSGVMVSVYDIEDVARDSLTSAAELTSDAASSLEDVQAEIARLDEEIAAGDGDLVLKRSERAYKALRIDYFTAMKNAGDDPHARKAAELAYTRAALAFFESPAYPAGPKYDDFKKARIEQLKKQEAGFAADVKRMESRLKERDSAITQVGYMPAVLVDEVTAARVPLTFVVGERRYVAADNLEVVIADVTGPKGRVFDGRGSGFLGAGRQDAWLDAMDDMRKHLNRGRGYLSYQVPPQYAAWAGEIPNPMQLQLAIGSQIKEMVDDSAHVMTLAAIMAAPFTGGASLSILAVLAPIQAASSLYNIVNRALYSDLELDTEAVFDFINIATLGLGKVSTAGKFATKGVQIIATSSRVAIRLLNAGQLILISYETYHTLMEEADPNGDPRETRRRKLLKLLSWCEAASMPIAEKLWGEAHPPGTRTKGQPHETALPGERKTVTFADEPLTAGGKKKPVVQEGEGKPTDIGDPAAGRTPKLPEVTEGGIIEPTGTHEGPGGAGSKEAAGASKPSQAQLKGVPKSLHGNAVVVPGMGRNARVAYEMSPDGLITKVQLQMGEHASAADVQAHVAVAELMLKYSGLGGRLRRLRDHFLDLFTRPENQRPEVGSRAWEARLEMIKLDRMMRERHAELAKLADTPAELRDAAREAQLRDDLDVLQSQFNEHAEVFNAIEMATAEGRGFVAVEGLSEGERIRVERNLPDPPDGYRWRFRRGELEVVVVVEGKPKRLYDPQTGTFPVDTGVRVPERFETGDRRKAFRDLGGFDPATTFGGFIKLLIEQKIVSSREECIKAMGDPKGRTHDTVRGNLKEAYKTQLIEQITKPAYLKGTERYREVLRATGDPAQARRAAGMDELVRISERLGPEERGVFGERVYDELFGTEKGDTHVDITPAELAAAKGVPVGDIELGRSFDRMDGTTAREIKNVSSRLGPRERGQIDDMLAMVGSKVQPATGPKRKVERAAVAFLDPVGGVANASLAHEILSANPKAPLTFEFHTRSGKVVKVTAKNMDVLLDPNFGASLGLKAAATTPGG